MLESEGKKTPMMQSRNWWFKRWWRLHNGQCAIGHWRIPPTNTGSKAKLKNNIGRERILRCVEREVRETRKVKMGARVDG